MPRRRIWNPAPNSPPFSLKSEDRTQRLLDELNAAFVRHYRDCEPFQRICDASNWSVDAPQSWRGYGFSVIISSEGNVISSAKSLYGPEIVYAELPTKPAGESR